MKKFFKMEKATKYFGILLGWVAVYIVPGDFKLSFSRFSKWYRSNGYYKYQLGETLCLRQRNIGGYGIRPLATVVGHETDKATGLGSYLIAMERDETGDFTDWMKTGKVKGNPKRNSLVEEHFKWNIEHQFIPCMT